MIYLRVILLFIVISISVLLPVLMVVAGFVCDISPWGRVSLVGGGLLLAWLIKPLSIVTGRNWKII